MKLYTQSLLNKHYQFTYWQLWKLKLFPLLHPPKLQSTYRKKQMTSSYPLDWPLARFSKNFISKISFTPSEWTASVKSSSVVHWKIFLILSCESLSKTPWKGQLSFPCPFFFFFFCMCEIGQEEYFIQAVNIFWILENSRLDFTILRKLVLKIYTHPHMLHCINSSTQYTSYSMQKKICIWVTFVFWECKASTELFQ